MVRFHRGSPRLGRDGDLAALVIELNRMDDFVQVGDRDAAHLIGAMGFDRAAFVRGLDAGKVTMAAAKILKMIRLGQGKEFSRSPAEPTDDGLDPFEVQGLVEQLAELATRAEQNGRAAVAVLIFDEELIAPPK